MNKKKKNSRFWFYMSVAVVAFFALRFAANHVRGNSFNAPFVAEAHAEDSAAAAADASASPATEIGSIRKLDTPLGARLLSFFGIFVLIMISYAMSVDRKNINWRPVLWGVALQLIFGLIVLSDTVGYFFFTLVDSSVNVLLSFSEEGAAFVFGKLAFGPGNPRGLNEGMFFFFSVLPTIVFFSSLMTILYHLGVMQFIVEQISHVMRKTMRTSGSETLSAAANIFVGQTEAPLVIKPFIKNMTTSELHAIMTGGFATVAGGVMAAYVLFLKDFIPNIAGHLVTASIMSAPAALAVSKIVYPQTEHSETAGDMKINVEKPDANVIEAGARGASEGMSLMLNVAAMLMAFVGLIAMVNFGLEKFCDLTSIAVGRNPYRLVVDAAAAKNIKPGDTIILNNGIKDFEYNVKETREKSVIIKERLVSSYKGSGYTVKRGGKLLFRGAGLKGHKPLFFVNLSILFGIIFSPIAWVMGVPWREASVVGRLLGEKLILTEFIAYLNLAGILKTGYHTLSGNVIMLSQRSAVIASYALCGFANFASIGIQIGGIGGIAPNKRAALAKIGIRAMFAGAIAACMTGTVAGILM
ncbi:MAG: nucleoside transporter C-terminal domain-containing protein [Elusimicrobiota bacterium]|nr:nucleoside transporter C-terminal domain-containing protein [Elusimicrobiota bacterium]